MNKKERINKIIELHKEGHEYTYIKNHFPELGSTTFIEKIIYQYKNNFDLFGEKNEKYNYETKVAAVNLFISNRYTAYEIAKILNIKNCHIIYQWLLKYKKLGYNGLEEKKRGPESMKRKEIVVETKDENENDIIKKLKEENKELKEEINRLMQELYCLKKLDALVREKELKTRKKLK